MFAFEIWGRFGCFRDPLGISQNITLQLPPKTTIAGMMASILGLEDYLKQNLKFEYSVILLSPIVKKTFSQNYINRKIATPHKPTNRELLINPHYMVFIKNFKLENEITYNMKNRICKFPFYIGNSEFAGNFKFKEINHANILNLNEASMDSFLLKDDMQNIIFEEDVIYSPIRLTTALNASRAVVSSADLIFSSNKIKARNIFVDEIICDGLRYYCRFV